MVKNAPITQEDPFGCGVACVAFALGFSYQKTLKLFKKGKQKAKTKGFYCKDLVRTLNNQGRNFKYRYIKDMIRNKIYQNNTIVFIKRSRKYPWGHYLCRYENSWMDPWINFPENKNIRKARPGLRKRLPGYPIYAIIPQ